MTDWAPSTAAVTRSSLTLQWEWRTISQASASTRGTSVPPSTFMVGSCETNFADRDSRACRIAPSIRKKLSISHSAAGVSSSFSSAALKQA